MKKLVLWIMTTILMLVLSGCGNTNIVKDGILDLDKSISVGEAFDRYKYFKNVTWDDFKADNGRDIVEVQGTLSQSYINEKNQIIQNKLKNVILTVQFQINKDDTFEIYAINIEMSGENGKVVNVGEGVSFANINQLLLEIYQDKIPSF